MTEIENIIKEDAAICESVLENLLSEDKIGSGALQDAMRYSTLGGGKRIRACLAFEFCRMISGDIEKAKNFAGAIEMVHAYSLIHDDLPCMDDDEMRRGKPSCHVAFGEATALLAGDTLLTYAMEAVSCASGVTDFAIKNAIRTLAFNAGSLGMAGGQQSDLENCSDTYQKLKKLHSMKTGALIKAAATLGYLATVTDSTDERILNDISEYAECIGLAFQIKDDLLDLDGDAATLGKNVGVDEKNGRYNALSFMSREEAIIECTSLAEKASDIFAEYDNSEFVRKLPFYLNLRRK